MKTSVIAFVLISLSFMGCASHQATTPAKPAPTPAVGKQPIQPLSHYTPPDRACKNPSTANACSTLNRQQNMLNQSELHSAGVQVVRMDDTTLRLDIPCDLLFAIDSDTLNPSFYPTLSQIAHILAQYPQSVIHIYGYTDSTASYAYNQDLSERRAYGVAHFLMNCGIRPQRIVTEGYSESYPRSTNATKQGRSLNRRVEIYIRGEQQGVNLFKPMYGGQGTRYSAPLR